MPKIPCALNVKSETLEQSKFITQARAEFPGVLIFAVANGGSRHKLEAIRLQGEGVLAGVPDVYVETARGGWFGARLEFKKTTEAKKVNGGVSEDQRKIHVRLTAAGYYVRVVYGCEHAMDVLLEYLKQPQTVPRI